MSTLGMVLRTTIPYGQHSLEMKKNRKKKENLLLHCELCHIPQDPRYHSCPFGTLALKKSLNGAVKTASTSFASKIGISDTSGSAFSPKPGS